MVAAGIEHAIQAPAAAAVAPVSDSSDSSSSDEELDAPNPVMGPSSSSAAAAAAAADLRENVSIEDQIQRQKLASFLDEDSSTDSDAEEEDLQIKGEPLVVNEDGNATEDKNVDPLQPRDEKMSLLKADEEVEVQGGQDASEPGAAANGSPSHNSLQGSSGLSGSEDALMNAMGAELDSQVRPYRRRIREQEHAEAAAVRAREESRKAAAAAALEASKSVDHQTVWLAALAGDAPNLKRALDDAPSGSVNAVGVRGWSALYAATTRRAVDAVDLLLERGADPNLITEHGWTPLMVASHLGLESIVQKLIDHGAKVAIRNDALESALDLSASLEVPVRVRISDMLHSAAKAPKPNESAQLVESTPRIYPPQPIKLVETPAASTSPNASRSSFVQTSRQQLQQGHAAAATQASNHYASRSTSAANGTLNDPSGVVESTPSGTALLNGATHSVPSSASSSCMLHPTPNQSRVSHGRHYDHHENLQVPTRSYWTPGPYEMQQRWLQQRISPLRGPLSPEAKQEVKQEVMEEVAGIISGLKEELAAARAQSARAELEAAGVKDSVEKASAASKAAKEEAEANAARQAEAKAIAKAAKAAAKAAKEEEEARRAREAEERAHAEAAAAAAAAAKEEEEARLAREAEAREAAEAAAAAIEAAREEAEARAAKEAQEREAAEAAAAAEAARREEEEARIARESEGKEVAEAKEARLKAEQLKAEADAMPDGPEKVIAEAKAAEAMKEAERQEAEAAAATLVRQKEEQEATHASEIAEKEVNEAAAAKEEAEKQAAEAAAAAAEAEKQAKEAAEAAANREREEREAAAANAEAELKAAEAAAATAAREKEEREATEARAEADHAAAEAAVATALREREEAEAAAAAAEARDAMLLAERQAYEMKLVALEAQVEELRSAERQRSSGGFFAGIIHFAEEITGMDLDGDGMVGPPIEYEEAAEATAYSPPQTQMSSQPHPVFDPAYHRPPQEVLATIPQPRFDEESPMPQPRYQDPPQEVWAVPQPRHREHQVQASEAPYDDLRTPVQHPSNEGPSWHSRMEPTLSSTSNGHETVPRSIYIAHSSDGKDNAGMRHSCSIEDQQMMATLARQAAQKASNLPLGTPQPAQRQHRQIFEEELAQFDGGRPRPTTRPLMAPQYAPAVPFEYTDGGVRRALTPPIVKMDEAASARAAIARIQAMNPPSASNAAMHLPPPHAAHVDGGTRQIRSDGAFGEARHQPIAHPSPDPNEQHVADGGNRMKTLITRHGILSPAHEAGARGIVNYVAAEAAESKTASGMLKNLWNDLTR